MYDIINKYIIIFMLNKLFIYKSLNLNYSRIFLI